MWQCPATVPTPLSPRLLPDAAWVGCWNRAAPIRLKGCPIDEAGMMILNENGPLIHGQMPNAFPDNAVFINVAFVLGLAVGVSASIHRIGQDLMQCVVSRRYPADRTRHSGGRSLQRKR